MNNIIMQTKIIVIDGSLTHAVPNSMQFNDGTVTLIMQQA